MLTSKVNVFLLIHILPIYLPSIACVIGNQQELYPAHPLLKILAGNISLPCCLLQLGQMTIIQIPYSCPRTIGEIQT